MQLHFCRDSRSLQGFIKLSSIARINRLIPRRRVDWRILWPAAKCSYSTFPEGEGDAAPKAAPSVLPGAARAAARDTQLNLLRLRRSRSISSCGGS